MGAFSWRWPMDFHFRYSHHNALLAAGRQRLHAVHMLFNLPCKAAAALRYKAALDLLSTMSCLAASCSRVTRQHLHLCAWLAPLPGTSAHGWADSCG